MLDEKVVVERCQAGNNCACNELFEHFRNRAYLLALQLTGHKEDALDICQDAFSKAFSALAKFDKKRSFLPWLLTIVRNTAFDALRQKKREQTCNLEDAQNVASKEAGPEEQLEAKDRKARLRNALNSLGDNHREVILLKDFHGLSYKDIALVLEVPLGTVMSRLHSARQALKRALEEVK